jgi:hypothetical protein
MIRVNATYLARISMAPVDDAVSIARTRISGAFLNSSLEETFAALARQYAIVLTLRTYIAFNHLCSKLICHAKYYTPRALSTESRRVLISSARLFTVV